LAHVATKRNFVGKRSFEMADRAEDRQNREIQKLTPGLISRLTRHVTAPKKKQIASSLFLALEPHHQQTPRTLAMRKDPLHYTIKSPTELSNG
jgi:hypothetical protein